MKRKNYSIFFLLLIFLSACNIKKKAFQLGESDLTVQEDYLMEGTDSLFQQTTPLVEWWQQFNDPLLDSLIVLARNNNLEVQVAIANLFAARASIGVRSADQIPTVEVNGSALRQRFGENIFAAGGNLTFNQYNGSFDVFWEADLFGRIKNQVAAAKNFEQLSLAELQGVYLSVFAEVARNYLELRGIQNQLSIARKNLDAQQNTYDLTVRLEEAGTSNKLDISRAEAQLKSTTALLPTLEADLQAIANRLCVLTGQLPGELQGLLQDEVAMPNLPNAILVGSGMSFIRRRPDIFSAEQAVMQQIARYNISVTDLYPRISLNGSIGFSAIDFSNFGKKRSLAWNLGPSISWAGLNFRRVRNQIAAEDAFTHSVLHQYEQVVLSALEEIKTSMSFYTKSLERQRMLTESVLASQEAAQLARQRYEVGLDDFLDYLNAERTLLLAENDLALNETALALNLINIYKALGGGWENISMQSIEDTFINRKSNN